VGPVRSPRTVGRHAPLVLGGAGGVLDLLDGVRVARVAELKLRVIQD